MAWPKQEGGERKTAPLQEGGAPPEPELTAANLCGIYSWLYPTCSLIPSAS